MPSILSPEEDLFSLTSKRPKSADRTRNPIFENPIDQAGA